MKYFSVDLEQEGHMKLERISTWNQGDTSHVNDIQQSQTLHSFSLVVTRSIKLSEVRILILCYHSVRSRQFLVKCFNVAVIQTYCKAWNTSLSYFIVERPPNYICIKWKRYKRFLSYYSKACKYYEWHLEALLNQSPCKHRTIHKYFC